MTGYERIKKWKKEHTIVALESEGIISANIRSLKGFKLKENLKLPLFQ